ncbi:MAG: ribonuclease J [Maricaulaceae bacterium]|jgi:ribonuclease J
MSGSDEFVFLPLGGSGEIGMNLNLYGFGAEHDRKWIIVDLGVTFGDLTTPGVEVIMPDPSFIEEHADNLLAIVLTHAHEDHMGAVARLWPRLKAPIYATPFTAWLVRDRLAEVGLEDVAPVREIPLDARFEIGPFDLQLITITHSIPEPNALVVRTPKGVVLHTGDWKIDPEPQIGEPTDVEAIRAIGEEGVLAMVCDSTNVFKEGESGSEGDVRDELIKLVGELEGKVAIASFASNVARMETAVRAAEANGRSVCLVGRSMLRMAAAAKSVGMLSGVAPFVDMEDAADLPASKVLYLCTGSQGEPRAALSRIAAGAHRHVSLGRGDTVIFSSRVIPGNETAIHDLQNQLTERGVDVITDSDRAIHVSGHPCRDELKQMYAWARPRLAIPVHGERRHLLEHAKLAKGLQIPKAIAARNGDMILLDPDKAAVIDEVPAGRLHVDGEAIVPADADSLRERKRMSYNGHVVVALAVDDGGKIVDGPDVRAVGLPDAAAAPLEGLLDRAAEEAERVWRRLSRSERDDEDAAEDAVGRVVRRLVQQATDKRPLVETVILRV